MAKILLVEDDQNLAFLLQMQLEHEKQMVDVVHCGLDALQSLKDHAYDLVIMDWMLPDLSGVDVVSKFRNFGGRTPILMLTAKGAPEDMAQGLDAGADDYLVKPFHPTELGARVRALIRRPAAFAGRVLQIQDLELDTVTNRVVQADKEIELTLRGILFAGTSYAPSKPKFFPRANSGSTLADRLFGFHRYCKDAHEDSQEKTGRQRRQFDHPHQAGTRL